MRGKMLGESNADAVTSLNLRRLASATMIRADVVPLQSACHDRPQNMRRKSGQQ